MSGPGADRSSAPTRSPRSSTPRARAGCPRTSPTPQRRRRMRAVDFTRPTKFTADQERRLKRSLEAFCRTASTRLSAELRVPLELEVINTSQLTWSNAHGQVLAGSISRDRRGRADRDAPAAERRAGPGARRDRAAARRRGDHRAARAPPDRHRLGAGPPLLRPPARAALGDLDRHGPARARPSTRLETHMETAQMVPVSEPTLTFTMEARFNGVSSTIVAAAPLVGDRAGGGPLRRPATTRPTAARRRSAACAAPSAASR